MEKNYWLSHNPKLKTYFGDWLFDEANIHKIKNHTFFKMLLHEPDSLNEKDVLIIKKFIYNLSEGLSKIQKDLPENNNVIKELISRLTSKKHFYSAYSEIILYLYFRRKNLLVQMYPSISMSNKKGDFKIKVLDRWVNVELKTPDVSDKIKSKETFRDMIMRQIQKLPFPYIIIVNCSIVPSNSERKSFISWLKSELQNISQIQKFPINLGYPNNNNPTIEIHVIQRLDDTEHTLIGGYGYGTYGLAGTSRVKKLISEKTRGQISSENPNLIVIDISHSDIHPFEAHSFVNYPFSDKISAILIYKDNPFSTSQTLIISWVFPNRHASNPLNTDELNRIGEVYRID
jgi:hypothetical protein